MKEHNFLGLLIFYFFINSIFFHTVYSSDFLKKLYYKGKEQAENFFLWATGNNKSIQEEKKREDEALEDSLSIGEEKTQLEEKNEIKETEANQDNNQNNIKEKVKDILKKKPLNKKQKKKQIYTTIKQFIAEKKKEKKRDKNSAQLREEEEKETQEAMIKRLIKKSLQDALKESKAIISQKRKEKKDQTKIKREKNYINKDYETNKEETLRVEANETLKKADEEIKRESEEKKITDTEKEILVNGILIEQNMSQKKKMRKIKEPKQGTKTEQKTFDKKMVSVENSEQVKDEKYQNKHLVLPLELEDEL